MIQLSFSRLLTKLKGFFLMPIYREKTLDFSLSETKVYEQKPFKTEMKHVFLTTSFPIALTFIL